MKTSRIAFVILTLALVLAMALPALAATTVWYTGQGFTQDGESWFINDERCGGPEDEGPANDGGTGQFADWNGPGMPYQEGQPYLVWVLTANGATSAKLYLPGGPVDMFKVGGTFKYASGYYSPEEIIDIVYATYEGKAKGSVNLVVSHGCGKYEAGAWCSPGYWRNARDGAWALIGVSKSALFNQTVYDYWYGATFDVNPTLETVLGDAPTYSGPPLAGTSGYALNAYNATGAYLTDQIPGFSFDWDSMVAGGDSACPIDSFGNFKEGAE
jgi:hypothetical protein